MYFKRLSVYLVMIATSTFLMCPVNAKSIYAITDHGLHGGGSGTSSKISTYGIDGNEINLQFTLVLDDVNYPTGFGYGPVGLAIDIDSEYMFVTHESKTGCKGIQIIDAATMTDYGWSEAPGATDLAGIVYDHEALKVYAIDRNTDNLFVFSWNSQTRTLTLDGGEPNQLAEIGNYGCGLALDELTDILYVSSIDDHWAFTNVIHYYRMSDFSHQGTIEIEVGETEYYAVALAVYNDGQGTKYLYTGSYEWEGSPDTHLVRTDLNDPEAENAIIAKDIGYGATGIAVDSDTGLVYVTRSDDYVAVYDTSNWTTEQGQSISPTDEENYGVWGPAGLCTAGDVAYKTDAFSIIKQVSEPEGCVSPYVYLNDNYVVYEINWDANGFADNDVNIIDFLPKGVNEPNYISDDGEYDPDTHSVVWDINDVNENDSGTYYIQVAVNKWAQPGRTITNKVKMEGDNYLSWHIIDTNVCWWGSTTIHVDKDATNGYKNGTNWDDAYTNLRDAFMAAKNLGSEVNAIWVAEGNYTPVWGVDENDFEKYSFGLLENVGVFGHFGGIGTYETDESQRNLADANNETILEGQIGQSPSQAVLKVVTAENIEDALLDGFTIQGSSGGSGAYLNYSDVSIFNCKFMNNSNYGIEMENDSNSHVHNCVFFNNSSAGIKASTNCGPTVTFCTFDGNVNTSNGIAASNSDIVVEKTKFANHEVSGIQASNGTFTITDCNFINDNSKSIKLDYSNATITNCSIKNCGDNSIYALHPGNLTVHHTLISNSNSNALYASDCNLTLTNSVLRHSGQCGVLLEYNPSTTIKNNWIHNNGSSGISLANQVSVPLIHNNTIFGNDANGIQSSQYGADPNILNCIIYGNLGGDLYRKNGDFYTVRHCILQSLRDGDGNKFVGPGFMNSDPCDLHIAEDSPCRESGDPNYIPEPNETDIDGEGRVKDVNVDIGADEYYWSPADVNKDGFVNFIDYSYFANAWMSNYGDGDYNEACDFIDINSIDLNDLAFFCEDWLWEKGWGDQGWMMSMGSGFGYGMSMFSSFSPQTNSGSLMLPDISDSINAMPDSLYAKVQKYYTANPVNQPVYLSAQQKAALVEDTVDWLDDLWDSDQLTDCMTYTEYLDFRDSIVNF